MQSFPLSCEEVLGELAQEAVGPDGVAQQKGVLLIEGPG